MAARFPLHAAVAFGDGDDEALRLLRPRRTPEAEGERLRLGTETDNHGWTPLHLAVYGGKLRVVRALLQLEHPDDAAKQRFIDAANDDGATALLLAAQKGDAEALRMLLGEGASPHGIDRWGNGALGHAARSARADAVELLLEAGAGEGASLDAHDESGQTPLFWACQVGADTIVRELLLHGAGFQANHVGRTPLHIACFCGHDAVVRTLLAHGHPIDGLDRDFCSALHLASYSGSVGSVHALLTAGANANALVRTTPLYDAARQGHASVITLLLRNGAKPDLAWASVASVRLAIAEDAAIAAFAAAGAYAATGHRPVTDAAGGAGGAGASHGDDPRGGGSGGVPPHGVASRSGMPECSAVVTATPLFAAASRGHTDAITALLRGGADVNLGLQEDRSTPLFAAAQAGCTAACAALIAAGAKVNSRTRRDATALLVACEMNKRHERGHSDGRDPEPESRAIADGDPYAEGTHYPVCELLLRAGADVDAMNTSCITPLYHAAFDGHLALVELLIEHGASVDIANVNLCTPLYVACQGGHTRVVGALLRAGADPRRRQKTGASPLIIAAVQGHLAIVRLLLGSPTSGMPLMRAIDKDGKTAIELAAQFGQADVVEYMRRFEASAIR